MSVPTSPIDTSRVRNFNPSSVPGLSGIPDSRLHSVDAREGTHGPTFLGGIRPSTTAPDNVTYRYRPRFLTFQRVLNAAEGRPGFHQASHTMPARLQALPEEDPDVNGSLDPGWHGHPSSMVTRCTKQVHYSRMHAGYPELDDIDSYFSGYVPTRDATFTTRSPRVDGEKQDKVESITNGFGSFYVLGEQGNTNSANAHLPPSQGVPYRSLTGHSNHPPTQVPVSGPPPVLQQPQPSRPFAMPVISRAPSVRPQAQIQHIVPQYDTQVARSSSAMSWRRTSRPASAMFQAQAPFQPPNIIQHQAPEATQYPNAVQYPSVTQYVLRTC